jgi:hypothetical protein
MTLTDKAKEEFGDYPTRTEAINKAIVKANEIFNTFVK